MPKKKPPQNAYQLFSTDWKKQHEDALDAADLSQAEVLKLCEAAWKESPARQNHYKEIAAKAKGKTIKLVPETRYTSFGDTVESKEAEVQEIQAFIDKMILEIKTTVDDLSSSSMEALVSCSFFLIHANYYIEWTAENKFIPCEVAIVEYSVADGIRDTLHFFPAVDTPDGLLPLGYAFEAKDKADTTHQIPPPPFEPAEYDYLDLSSRVLNFLTKNGSTSIPPVYTMDDNMNHNHSKSTVTDFMELLRDFSGKEIRVYRLPLLFFELYNACSKFDFGTKEPFESEVRAQQELCLDHYLYVQGISCTFHALLESDAHRFCSKSTVQRWAYILSEYCCREVGIQPIPGKHGPAESKDDLASTKQVYVPGREAGVLSEVYKDPSQQYAEDAGIRLPKTRGKADMLRSRQKHVDLRGFTKDEFPQLGGTRQYVSQWEAKQPRDLTKDDFPALGARPKSGGGKQNGRV